MNPLFKKIMNKILAENQKIDKEKLKEQFEIFRVLIGGVDNKLTYSLDVKPILPKFIEYLVKEQIADITNIKVDMKQAMDKMIEELFIRLEDKVK